MHLEHNKIDYNFFLKKTRCASDDTYQVLFQYIQLPYGTLALEFIEAIYKIILPIKKCNNSLFGMSLEAIYCPKFSANHTSLVGGKVCFL